MYTTDSTPSPTTSVESFHLQSHPTRGTILHERYASPMHFLLQKIRDLDIDWNERPLGESDAYELCSRLGVTVEELPMTSDGFYFRVMGRDTIAVNRGLAPAARLKVLFHEIAHLLFHAPVSGPAAAFHHVGGRTRAEVEADAFAVCAIIPLCEVIGRERADLVDAYSESIVAERLAVLRKYGF